jgi:hypothetical protein
VAGPLADPVGATLRARPEPLHRRALVDVRRLDDEQALVERLGRGVGLDPCVGDRALHDLAHRLAGGLRRELQHRDGLGRLTAADEIDDAPGLRGRDADVPRLRLGFHR